jgi:2-phosphoglycerate kinase
MNYLYLIGGSPRSGKTTILKRFLTVKPMIAIQTDAIREGLRSALIDEKFVTISKLSISGEVIFQRLTDNVNADITKRFSQEISQDELIWKSISGLISYYDGKGVDVVIEGIEITPDRIRSLNLKDLKTKAVFVGITEHSNFNKFIESNDDQIEKRLNEEIQKSRKVAADAQSYGYKFLSLDSNNFDGYCDNVVNYLISMC